MSLKVGAVMKISNGAGIEEVKIKMLEPYYVGYVGKTPKGRWGSKLHRISRKAFHGAIGKADI